MKEMNSLEMHLRSWRPRRPSAKLRQRIFGTRSNQVTATALLRWLAPAMVCALVAVGLLTQPNSMPAGRLTQGPMVGMILSNQSPVASLSNEIQQAGGSNFSGTFEWTNHTGSTSSVGSFLSGKVN